jgi:hypothetical protein
VASGIEVDVLPGQGDQLLLIAAERARRGNMAAVSFLAARQPDEQEAELRRLLERLGAGDG